MNKNILLLTLVILLVVVSPVEAKFLDMPDNWAREGLEFAIEYNILKGDDQGRIRPDFPLNRAELAAMLSRLLNLEEMADISNFKDMDKSKWYYEDMAKVVEVGIMEGKSEEKLSPNISITREEVFIMLSRMLALENREHDLEDFDDWENISSWSIEEVNNLVTEGYLDGDKNKMLHPKEFIRRSEVAQLIYNIAPNISKDKKPIKDKNFEGNLLINKDVKFLDNVKVNGDLILTEGVKGNIDLKNVEVEGRLLLRNSSKVNIDENCKIEEIVNVFDTEVN